MKMFCRFSLLIRVLAFCAIALAFTDCASMNESLNWNLGNYVQVMKQDTGWKGINGRVTWRRVYAKPGETASNWTIKREVTELPIAITSAKNGPDWNPESVMNSEKARRQKQGCSTDKWTVLQQDKSSILYEWQNIKCPTAVNHLTQHELTRIVLGHWYLWFLSYGIRNRPLSPAERTRLIDSLLKAEVVHETSK